MSAFADNCPACGVSWTYEHDGRRLTRIIAVMVGDRVGVWQCPDCNAEWQRGSQAVRTPITPIQSSED